MDIRYSLQFFLLYVLDLCQVKRCKKFNQIYIKKYQHQRYQIYMYYETTFHNLYLYLLIKGLTLHKFQDDMPAQSFGCAHRGRMCMCAFIGVSVCACI